MSNDDSGTGGDDLCDAVLDSVSGGEHAELLGDYVVRSPGVHIVLDGRTVTHPDER